MKYSFKYVLILAVVAIVSVISCKNKEQVSVNSNSDETNFDEKTNWILLDIEDALENENAYTWDFQSKHLGLFKVQILYNGDIPLKDTLVSMSFNEKTYEASIKKTRVDYANNSIFEFRAPIDFNQRGSQQIEIKTRAPFKQLRIVPDVKNQIGSGKYHKEWLQMHQSPEKQKTLNWFKEAKFGMFIHWGLYSQTAGVWKGTQIKNAPYPGPKPSEWLMHSFRIPREEYKELVKTFKPDKSFAENFAKLAKNVGMKYVVITSKHHDGFAMFDSEVSDYDITDATPYDGDIILELYEACLNEGIEFGVYYSLGNDWFNGSDGNYNNTKYINDSLGLLTHKMGKNLWDPSPNTHAEYLETKALPQITELIKSMPKLRLIWFDGTGFINEDQSFKFYKQVYNSNPNILVNRRIGWGFGDYTDTGDNNIPASGKTLEKYFETCGTTNNSWAYKVYDKDWKSPGELLYYFVDILSKGGNYLLNIGPDELGNVPKESKVRLLEMGDWIKINSDAIYGTTPWKIKREGQSEILLEGTRHREIKGFSKTFTENDFWFTAKKNKVYAISLVNPKEKISIKSLKKDNGSIKSVRMLGTDKTISWEQTDSALEVDLNKIETNKNGYALEIQF
ncbi:alpha-L-fucosidase [Joostella sp.]|uniref:alpha-L-fucosidase n=1 Tax=Joostella sp. TaxID=2231138 RepID=UPI003A8DE44A